MNLLNLQKVGWVVAHPPREKGFFFSGPEVLFAAEQQLEAAQGVNDTPFVTVKVTLDAESRAVVESFQVRSCVRCYLTHPRNACLCSVCNGTLRVTLHPHVNGRFSLLRLRYSR